MGKNLNLSEPMLTYLVQAYAQGSTNELNISIEKKFN